MKLSITRDQDKGMLGGISFALSARLLVDEHEAADISKYRVGPLPILVFGDQSSVTVDQLLGGWTQKAKEIDVLLGNEDELVSGAKEFYQSWYRPVATTSCRCH